MIGPGLWTPSVYDYVDARRSHSGLSRDRFPSDHSRELDRRLREAAAATVVDVHLSLECSTEVSWGQLH